MDQTVQSSLETHEDKTKDLDSTERNSLEGINLHAFLKDNYNDSIILLTKSNYHLLQRPLLVVFDQFKIKGTELKDLTDTIYKISLNFPKTIQFAIMDFEDAELFHLNWNELYYYSFKSYLPYIFGVDENNRQHEFDDNFTPDTLIQFCKYLEKNEHYYSEPIPLPTEQNRDQNVDIIVADNFRQLVEQNDKDVFVTLHSKYSFAYEFNLWNVPRELKDDNESLVFYGICIYTNYIPLEYRAWEYPTSFLIPRNDKSKRLKYVHKYCDGPEILHFIAKNVSTELKTVDRNGCYKDAYRLNKIECNQKPKIGLDGISERVYTVVDNLMLRSNGIDDGFSEFLESILKKVNSVERNKIEMELVILALSRINKIKK